MKVTTLLMQHSILMLFRLEKPYTPDQWIISSITEEVSFDNPMKAREVFEEILREVKC